MRLGEPQGRSERCEEKENRLALLRIEAWFFSRLACRLVAISTTVRATAQAVSRRLPTVTARVRSQVTSCDICCGQSGTGAGFLRVLRFPLPILIPPTTPHSSSSIIRGWYSRRTKGRCNKWTQSHPTPRNKKNKCMDFWAISAEISQLLNFTLSLKLQLCIRTSSSTEFLIENGCEIFPQ
jgi:hypothetical protein